MNKAWTLVWGVVGASLIPAAAQAQVPDLLNSFEAGGASLGMGGSLEATDADTLSAYYNPAGLGYLQKREFGINYRNLPRTFSVSTGPYADRFVATNGTPGTHALTHVGLAVPLSDVRKGSGGVVALTYTIGGQMDDEQTSPGLTSGALTIQNYELDRSARSDFFTLAYGRANAAQTMSFGIGLDYLRQQTAFSEVGTFVDGTGTPTGAVLNTNNSDNGNGIGATVGVLGQAGGKNNASWGASWRSPIDIKGNPNTAAEYSRIPGRVLGGVAVRNDNLRGGRDFAIFAAQVGYYYDGQGGPFFDRSNQTTASFGVEYDMVRSTGRFPLRFGYEAVPSGGAGFASRNALTYGLGYRPDSGKYIFDLNFASPQNGGYDVSISLDYRFDK